MLTLILPKTNTNTSLNTNILIWDSLVLQSWPKCVGQSAFFPNCCSIRSLPPSPPTQCWTIRRQAFPYEQHCMGGGEESRIWPKEHWFPCEKLIDGRGSAFCKLVPHNFGQDCRFKNITLTLTHVAAGWLKLISPNHCTFTAAFIKRKAYPVVLSMDATLHRHSLLASEFDAISPNTSQTM